MTKPLYNPDMADDETVEPKVREDKGPILPFELLRSIRSAMESGVPASQIIFIVEINTMIHSIVDSRDGDDFISRLRGITQSIQGDMENTKKQEELAERVRIANGGRWVAGTFVKDKKRKKTK